MHSVQLYLYDLSGGMAAAMSQQLTGRYFEAVWHSSVVVHGMEVYFGQGIFMTRPGTTHHGSPLKKLDMGTTSIDEQTFREYVQGLKDVYRAEKYHLLSFNCNNFSNDVCQFLCGRAIPQDILDLPKQFLSTPFGASLRPQIERMFAQNGPAPDAQDAVQSLTNGAAPDATTSLTSPLTICSNLASFNDLIASNDVVVAMFTKDHCPPCSMIKPVFEDLAFRYVESPTARATRSKRIAFVLVDTGLAHPVASRFDIRATPTFLFFRKGSQVHQLKGASQGELKTQCDLLISQTYPPNPHLQLRLPVLSRLIQSSALVDLPVNFKAALFKFNGFLSALPEASSLQQTYQEIVVPVLKKEQKLDQAKATKWTQADSKAFNGLPEEERFPVVDFLRLACLSEEQTRLLLPSVEMVLDFAAAHSGDGRLTFMISLRLLTNALPSLFATKRTEVTRAAIEGLLHNDGKVRTAAATLAFRMAQLEVQQRVDWQTDPVADDEEAFETELMSAVLETLRGEEQESVSFRLLATIGLLAYKSSNAQELRDLFQALDGPELLHSKGGALKEGERDIVLELDKLFQN